MNRSSSEPSDSAQFSQSSRPSRRRPTRRRLLRHRRRLLPPSSTSSQSETPITSDNTQSQLNSSNSFISSPPFISYINVAPLPIFRGLPDECPVSHLSRFERVCSANNASSIYTMARIFSVSLLDDAAIWYEISVESRPEMSWEETKSAFVEAFRAPEFADRARAEILSLRQRDGESVSSYHLRMRGILKRWPEHGLPESLIRGLFVDGLRGEFHDWVVPRRPETVEEAVRVAMDWEGAEAARSARRGGGGERCGFCEGRHEEAGCEVKRRMKEWMRMDRDEEGGVERFERVGSVGRRSQCQCWKHQCGKKYERNGSGLTIRSAAVADTAAAADS